MSLSLVFLSLLVSAPPVCTVVHSPFVTNKTSKSVADRKSFARFNRRVTSEFAAHRSSFQKGHKHGGVDLKTRFNEPVYAMCEGEVVDILLVVVGDEVGVQTQIGRVFNRLEQKNAPWAFNHLHLD